MKNLLFVLGLFQGLVGPVKVGLTNCYRILDAGVEDKEAKSTAMVEKHKNNQQNLDTPPAEYKLPLVWIDLEMTGKYVLEHYKRMPAISKVFYKSLLDIWMESNHWKEVLWNFLLGKFLYFLLEILLMEKEFLIAKDVQIG